MKRNSYLQVLFSAILILGIVLVCTSALATQYAMWVADDLYVKQGMNESYSHSGMNSIDIVGVRNADIKAPFDATIVEILDSFGWGNSVVIQSNEPVCYANGTVDYMTVVATHDNDISDCYKGKIIPQGEVFAQNGNYGYVSGVHTHLTVIQGKYAGTRQISGSEWWTFKNDIDPTTALFIDDSVKIYDTRGLSFRNIKDIHTHDWDGVGVCTICGMAFDWQGNISNSGTGVFRANETSTVHSSPYNAASSVGNMIASREYDVVASTTNAFGNKWYHISSGGIDGWQYAPLMTHVRDFSSGITFSDVADPPNQKKGAGFTVTGSISSVYPIVKLEAFFIDANTNAETSTPSRKTRPFNKTSISLQQDMDDLIYFAQLQEGTWKMALRATDSQGVSETYTTNAFTVGTVTPSSIAFSDVSQPVDQIKGAGYYMGGTITSNYPITKVEAYFVDASSGAATSTPTKKTLSFSSTTIDIASQVDPYLYFAELQIGTWKLVMTAWDSKGAYNTHTTGAFSVSSPASSIQISVCSIPDLEFKHGFYTSGTITSRYSITKVEGYFISADTGAMASTPVPQTKNLSGTNIDIASQVDDILWFASLPAGKWKLVLKATDSAGQTETYYSNAFNVIDNGCIQYGCSTSVAGWYRVTSGDGLVINPNHEYTEQGIYTMPANAIVWVSKGSTSSATYYHVNYNGIEGISSRNYLKKLNSYTLTFNDNGGSNGPGSVTVWDGIGDYNTVAVPSRLNHIFLGYYTAENGGTQVYNAAGYCTNEGSYWSNNAYVRGQNATLYAHWVVDRIYCTSISLDQTSITLALGGEAVLNATVLPEDADDRRVNWFSDDVQVVTVNNGTLQAVGIGSTTIKAETVDGSDLVAVCTVTVQPVYIYYLELWGDYSEVVCGRTIALRAYILPMNATNKDLIWTSSDESVATVDYGIIHGISPGTATITVLAADGSGISASYPVTVYPEVIEFHLDEHSITLATDGIGSHYSIPYTILPITLDSRIIWSSSAPGVAVVDAHGVVSAQSPGRAVISAEIPFGPSDACIIQVRDDLSLMTLPSDLQVIGEEAFENISADRVIIRDECTAIGARAFADSDLKYILIPPTVSEIDRTAFEGSEQVCLICGNGSAAQQVAQEEGIRYIIDDEAAFVSVRSISMQSAVSVEIEDHLTLNASVSPASASNPALIWSSSNENVAIVSDDGIITGVNPGTAVVTATAADGSGRTASCTVTVTLPNVQVQTAFNTAFQTGVAVTAQLDATVTITGAEADDVQQTCILLYDTEGNRIGISMSNPVIQGNALLCSCDTDADMKAALLPNTDYRWRCAVVVKGITFYGNYQEFTTPSLPPQIILNSGSITLEAGSTATLTANVLYTDDTDLIWGTSNSSVAMIVDGELVARNTGVATITVRLVSNMSIYATCEVTVTAKTSQGNSYQMSLSASSLTMTRGGSTCLEAALSPPLETTVQWRSSDTNVTAVDGNGTITALSAGCAFIFAEVPELNLQEVCEVTVLPILAEAISLNTSSLIMYVGSMDQLTAELLPVSADERTISWSSSDPGIVEVEDGLIRAVAEGSAAISASAVDGSGVFGSCTVTVDPAPVICGCETRYAGYYVISRTNGTGLAISSGHGASTAAGNSELGIIPDGTEIYISRASGPAGQSGCWGHVTYEGISGYCAMYYVDPVLNVDTSNDRINLSKLQAVINRANAWADFVWTAPTDIPVYNNDFDDPDNPTAYQQYFWYPEGTEMHGVPYTLASSKYRPDTYSPLSAANKGSAANFTYGGWLMWGPRYGGDCTCLVNDVLWAGDQTLPHDGQVYMTKKAYLYSHPSWDDLAPGDALATSGHAMIVTAVNGNRVTIVESRGNGSSIGAIHCQNKTVKEGGGWYVCGVCEFCNGSQKCGSIRRTVDKSALQALGYSIHRYKMLYVGSEE